MILSRRTLWLVSALSGLLMLGSGLELARRVVAYHRRVPVETFAFKEVDQPDFTWCGRAVHIGDDPASTAPRVLVTYADQRLELNVAIPPKAPLPGLARYSDWLRVLRFIPASRMDAAEVMNKLGSGDIAERLVLVTRSMRPGADPETWGAVWQKDWRFDFYELKPDGTIAHERLAFPTSPGMKTPRPGELHQNTWQFQAALMLMPKGPTYNFHDDALSAAGWTLPAAAISGLLCVLSAAFAAGPRTTRDVRRET